MSKSDTCRFPVNTEHLNHSGWVSNFEWGSIGAERDVFAGISRCGIGRLSFSHIKNNNVQNSRRNWQVVYAKVCSPSLPPLALPLYPARGSASRSHNPCRQCLDPPWQIYLTWPQNRVAWRHCQLLTRCGGQLSTMASASVSFRHPSSSFCGRRALLFQLWNYYNFHIQSTEFPWT